MTLSVKYVTEIYHILNHILITEIQSHLSKEGWINPQVSTKKHFIVFLDRIANYKKQARVYPEKISLFHLLILSRSKASISRTLLVPQNWKKGIPVVSLYILASRSYARGKFAFCKYETSRFWEKSNPISLTLLYDFS